MDANMIRNIKIGNVLISKKVSKLSDDAEIIKRKPNIVGINVSINAFIYLII
jgi:hypothetical protein